jgi:hypothetical protein|tara:strand:- start:7256 stop:7651 length:396 start_codon:yes stop_codon:yes gene_type:complete
MSFLGKLLGTGAAETIGAVADGLDKVFTSDDERLTHAEVLERIKQTPSLAQIDVNKTEAGHRSVFIAGWRPAVGWVCALGLANAFLVNPWIMWVTGKSGPELPLSIMMELVLALLGLGTLRTFEKLKGLSK